MKVEIITIGDELLLGFTIDTNSAWLARELAELGVEVARHTSVRDVREEIISEVGAALARTGCVITSGGLGPTSDDISVESVAAVFGRGLREDPSVIAHLEELLRSRGYTGALSTSNRRQALVPEGAEVLHNRHGTAPGIWLEDGEGRWVAMLPGVPREMKGLFQDELKKRITARAGEGGIIASRTIRTTGIAEAALSELIVKSGVQVNGLAYLPGAEGVDLRVTVRGLSRADAQVVLDRDIALLRKIAGDHVYGEEKADLAAVVLEMARQKGALIAVAESCTGGLLGSRLTAIPGSSDVFVGGAITYSNDVKVTALGVPSEVLSEHGAVSEQTVRAMAAGACERFGAQLGIAISGIAGPGGGTAEKPVGTVWVAVQLGARTNAVRRVLPGDRGEIRERAAQMALDMARSVLR